MNVRERFYKVMRFQKPDRLPMLEWAPYWDQTVRRWEGEGLPKGLSLEEIERFFGLENITVAAAAPRGKGCPHEPGHGLGIIKDEKGYEEILPHLYPPENIDRLVEHLKNLKSRHDGGELLIRIWLDGFFWYPRTLLGIETHLYSFYDQPELLQRMNADCCKFALDTVDAIYSVLTPDMIGLAEDMSYNHGPMLSKACFDEFLLPYYKQVASKVKERDVVFLVDSDGDVTAMVPWFEEAGVEGVYPFERQAGADIVEIRKNHPKFLIMGAYDKMAMRISVDAMRAEFERLLPVMRQGGFVNSVDHQTPPDVSIDTYREYVKLLREYNEKAAQ